LDKPRHDRLVSGHRGDGRVSPRSAIRKITIHQHNRAARSITDHYRIVEALERRDPELAERRAREHALGLAAHVEQHGDFLDTTRDDGSPARYK
jgi:hypothetical protein